MGMTPSTYGSSLKSIEKFDAAREVTVYGYVHGIERQILSLEKTEIPEGIINIIIGFYGNKSTIHIPSNFNYREQKRLNNRNCREIDREINRHKRDQQKAKIEMKRLAKGGDMDALKPIAKDLIRSQRVNKILTELRVTLREFSTYLDEGFAVDKFSQESVEKYVLKIWRMSKGCGIKLPCIFTSEFQV